MANIITFTKLKPGAINKNTSKPEAKLR